MRLIGVDGVIDLWGITRPKAYSDKRRGKWGPPDWIATGADVWLADRFGPEAGQVDLTRIDRDALPPLLGNKELALCFNVSVRTVETMQARGRQDVKTPEPYDRIGKTPVWWAPPWEEFARLTGRKFSLARLPPQSQRPGFIPYPKAE
ncbi:hypothetical protein [Nonomuraea sp. NPDC052265]|uniref:hypothetical protein n=1 Tax=Nonomuraea sp. NPDC052265 TaxID=3364374 RepID=UPI0037CB1FC7